jgi:hypothetical protein
MCIAQSFLNGIASARAELRGASVELGCQMNPSAARASVGCSAHRVIDALVAVIEVDGSIVCVVLRPVGV